ncbi:CCN family member 5 [Varanus komodoensis]|uniref:CCN family member 5 n=1 Tax=Varanus komodoensis TaxID=61221 RepID=A0A8D2L782_VARKO|nr:CCN family member 5 [Varanus komodoensis]
MKHQLLLISFFCLLSKLYAQRCQTPCYCPWIPPHCPPGSSLVLDGCGCCTVCARRLGEPCNYLHVCDQNQGLTCDYSITPARRGGICTYEEGDDDNCEVNGKIYRDGEVFQPSCKLQCRCSGGGFTCIPLCKEDVRLPTPDCPYPKRVEISGKCCPEWICESQERQNLPDAMAAQRLPAITSVAAPYPCDEWSTAWSACSSSCGIGISTRVSNQNPYCRLETQRRFCILGPCQGLMGRTSMRRRGSRL